MIREFKCLGELSLLCVALYFTVNAISFCFVRVLPSHVKIRYVSVSSFVK